MTTRGKSEKPIYAFRRQGCERCGGPIEPSKGETAKYLAKRRFCSVSCAMTGVDRSRAITPERIIRNSMPVPFSGCWIWMPGQQGRYGKITSGRRTISAHRASYEVFRGPIPTGLFVCHKCDIPECVNPDHLFAGTPKDNMLDMSVKGRAKYRRALTVEAIAEIRDQSGNTKALAHKFGVSKTTIKNARAGRTHGHVA